jgi:hypothetical protein
MMPRILALFMLFTIGCGTVLNSETATIHAPPGSTIDGAPASDAVVSQRAPHEVVFQDGRRCIVDTHISAGYIVADIVLLFLVGVVVDAVTGDWAVLNADACPGVIVD